jgi:hypothetical protein
MKTYYILIFLILFSLICKSQEYSLSLYFEDSIGNRDTLYFGEDSSATFGIDEQLGEVNLINEPLNSTFDVFFTDAVTGEMYDGGFDCYLEKPQTLTYISKKQFNDFHDSHFSLYDWIELGMISKHWPVTISWNQKEMADYVSAQGRPLWNLYMYSWNPPVSLIGDIHCCGYWPNNYTLLNETSQVSVEQRNFCHYTTTIAKDSISLFFIYYSSYTGLAEAIKGNASFRYDPKEKVILFLNDGEPKSGTIEVCDILGRVRIRKSIDNFTGTNLKIDANRLSNGTFIIRFSSIKAHSQSLIKKIQIL